MTITITSGAHYVLYSLLNATNVSLKTILRDICCHTNESSRRYFTSDVKNKITNSLKMTWVRFGLKSLCCYSPGADRQDDHHWKLVHHVKNRVSKTSFTSWTNLWWLETHLHIIPAYDSHRLISNNTSNTVVVFEAWCLNLTSGEHAVFCCESTFQRNENSSVKLFSKPHAMVIISWC